MPFPLLPSVMEDSAPSRADLATDPAPMAVALALRELAPVPMAMELVLVATAASPSAVEPMPSAMASEPRATELTIVA